MPESTRSAYWSRRVPRRTVLRGTATSIFGLAGAALLGCSSPEPTVEQVPSTRPTQVRTPVPEPTGSAVAADQVRLQPGIYRRVLGPTPAEANPAGNAVPGGTLVDRYLDPTNMDINRTLSCTVQHTMNLTNSRLTRPKVGAAANPLLPEIEPDLASSWEASQDNLEFTFHLRPGVKTHNVEPANGRELTSEDVRLSLERYRQGGSQKDVFAEVTAIEAPDASRVRLSAPRVDFPADLSAWSYIWIKELIENDELIQSRAVGTGPFIQETWTRGERTVFKKHPDYYEPGRPYLDGYVATVENDLGTQAKKFAENGLAFWTALDDADAEAMATRAQDMVVWVRPRSRGANINGWQFQMRAPSFRDERVRRAISLAIDRTRIDDSRNTGDNANPEGPYSNAPLPWPFLFNEHPTAKANGKYYIHDMREASRLLQAVGFTKDRPLRWTHSTWYDREVSAEIIPTLNANVPELRIEMRQVDSATQVATLADRSFQESAGIVWGPPGNTVDQWLYPWYHSKGGLNYGSKGNDELDRLLDRQRGESSLDARKATWQSIWDIIHDQVWDLWWPEAHLRSGWHNWVLNYRPHALLDSWVCYANHNISSMWLDKDAPQRNGS